ncbi:hypothetical protein F4774DRAFT_413222 [Daldinia eschscholtzii]|nr:hypothetical protein F4774DRAFT_413222 [Daldinia eschscholtzii]
MLRIAITYMNVKSPFLVFRTLSPTANPSRVAVFVSTSDMTSVPASVLQKVSAYVTAKLAEFVSLGRQNLFATAVHAGMVETAIFTKAGADASQLPMDTGFIFPLVQLPAHFIVWLSSPEVAVLNGRSVWANCDVEELKAQADTIQSGQLMTVGTYGWPFPNV